MSSDTVIEYLPPPHLELGNLTCADIISSKNTSKLTERPIKRNSQRGTSPLVSNIDWPETIPKPENWKRNKVFLKCRLCTKNKIKKETSYRCKGCPNKPPLCPGCFEQWHSQVENTD